MAVVAAFPPYGDRRSRSVLRRLALMLAVLVTSLSLVVTTSTPAAASIDVGNLAKAGTKGLKYGGPITQGGIKSTGPVGWIVQAGLIGWGVWSERDTWMGSDQDPDVTIRDLYPEGETPQGGVSTEGWTPFGGDAVAAVTLTQLVQEFVQVEIRCHRLSAAPAPGVPDRHFCDDIPSNQVYSVVAGNGSVAECRRGDGSTYQREPYQTSLAQRSRTMANVQPGSFLTWARVCPPGETVLGVKVAPGSVFGNSSYGLALGSFLQPAEYLDQTPQYGRVDVEVECRNAATDEVATLTSYTEQTETERGFVLPSCKQHLGEDWHGTKVKVQPRMPTIPEAPVQPILPPLEWEEPLPGSPDWDPNAGKAIEVWVDNTPCRVGVKECEEWEEIDKREPQRVTCRRGTSTLNKSWCRPMRDYYRPAHPRPDIDTNPGTGGGPGAGTDTPPVVVPSPDDVRDDPDNATGECFPNGWGLLNPVEWVYKPVRCALVWAFKPQTPLSTRISRMAESVENRAPFSWFARLSALPTSMGSSCPANWTWTQGGQSNPIICGTAMGDAVRGVRSVLSVLLMGAAVYPFIRSLVYAGTPVIKPTPSS